MDVPINAAHNITLSPSFAGQITGVLTANGVLLKSLLKEAAFSQETDEVFLVLVTIDHADLTDPIRVVNNTENITLRGDLYIAYPFNITLPDSREDTPPSARLQIDNVSREIGEAIRTMESPATVKIEVVRVGSPPFVELSFPEFALRDVNWDALTVSGELRVENFVNEPFPAGIFSPAGFPGLF